MITLTDSARKGIAAFLANKPSDPIRVYPQKNHAGGVSLALALDKIQEDCDEIEEVGGFTFCMNRDLKRMVHQVTIDQGRTGFVCTPLIPLPKLEVGCSCGGSCSGSGCSGCH